MLPVNGGYETAFLVREVGKDVLVIVPDDDGVFRVVVRIGLDTKVAAVVEIELRFATGDVRLVLDFRQSTVRRFLVDGGQREATTLVGESAELSRATTVVS